MNRPRWAPRRLAECRIGARGWLLATLAPWWIIMGVYVAFGAPAQDGTPIEAVPAWIRSVAWCGTALYAVASAPHPSRHTRAAALLMVMPAMRLASSLVQAAAETASAHLGWDAPYSSLPDGWLALLHDAAGYALMMRAVWMIARATPPVGRT